MASQREKQYYPVSTQETAVGDALSARAMLDMAHGINNALIRVYQQKILSEIFPGTCCASGTTTDETVRRVWAPRYLMPVQSSGTDGSFTCYAQFGIVGPSSGTARWRIYSGTGLYTLSSVYDTAWASSPAIEITSTSTTHAIKSDAGPVQRDGNNRVWLVLTSLNQSGAENSRLTTLDAAMYFTPTFSFVFAP